MKEIIRIIRRLDLMLKLVLSKIIIIFCKEKFNNIWLISETPNAAQDNGFAFFKFMLENHPDIRCCYVIKKRSPDLKKLKKIGEVVAYNSFKHVIFYLVSKIHIITHDLNTPQWSRKMKKKVNLKMKGKIIQLQHGVTHMESSRGFFFKEENYSIVCATSDEEKKLLIRHYSHPEKTIKITGLCRLDNLVNESNGKIILFSPTWRKGLEKKGEFLKSEYYKRIEELLINRKLVKELEKQKIVLLVYLHIAIGGNFERLKKYENKNVKIISINDVNIQDVLQKAALMITDYSSISYDFAYQKKPVIFYQWDSKKYEEEFEVKNFKEYQDKRFGDIVTSTNGLVNTIIKYISTEFRWEENYTKKLSRIFKYRDKKNCERVYKEITTLLNKGE